MLYLRRFSLPGQGAEASFLARDSVPVPVVIGDDRMVTPRFISLPDLQSQIVCTVLSALAGFSGNSVSESVFNGTFPLI